MLLLNYIVNPSYIKYDNILMEDPFKASIDPALPYLPDLWLNEMFV